MSIIPYINCSGRKVLEYNPDDSITLNLPFILTLSKRLVRNMPYLLLEGSRPIAVRLLNVQHEDTLVSLDVQELETNRTYLLSWNMDYPGDFWLWSLADIDTLMNLPK